MNYLTHVTSKKSCERKLVRKIRLNGGQVSSDAILFIKNLLCTRHYPLAHHFHPSIEFHPFFIASLYTY